MFFFYRNREVKLQKYFKFDAQLVCCSDVNLCRFENGKPFANMNIINDPLLQSNKIAFFPLLHTKFNLSKQFAKALDQNGNCFYHICSTFPGLSEKEKKAEVFDEPQIRTLLKNVTFVPTMNEVKVIAWNAFSDVIKNFLGKRRAENYKEIVEELLLIFQSLGCKMSIKLDYFQSH